MKVEVKNLVRYFGDKIAVDNISFSFESGNIFGFIGPNGAGKTTTIKVMATLDLPTCGDVFYDGVPVVREGGDAGTPESDLVDIVRKREFTVSVDLHDGDESYWVWTNDISYEYVKINADYHT